MQKRHDREWNYRHIDHLIRWVREHRADQKGAICEAQNHSMTMLCWPTGSSLDKMRKSVADAPNARIHYDPSGVRLRPRQEDFKVKMEPDAVARESHANMELVISPWREFTHPRPSPPGTEG